jgi:hypothetical protein
MGSAWLKSDGARKRVTEMLYNAGAPLELEVEAVCKQFADQAVTTTDTINIRSEKVVYSTRADPEKYREVDQLVTFYDELDVSDLTGVQLIAHIPIECKSRSNLEYFAFPVEQKTAYRSFPMWSELGWSQYLDSLRTTYYTLSDLKAASITMLQINNGEQPQNHHKENLHYNGAGALYDFVLFDAEDACPRGLSKEENEWIDETGTFLRLQQELASQPFPFGALRTYIHDLSLDQCRSFNEHAGEQAAMFYMTKLYIPILCVNGPIYMVKWEHSSGITGYEPTNACILQIRKQGWPGPLRYWLLNRTPEVPVILTNTEGLHGCLNEALTWYKRIAQTLTDSPRELLERVPLESALYIRAIEYYANQLSKRSGAFRSDLDLESWE